MRNLKNVISSFPASRTMSCSDVLTQMKESDAPALNSGQPKTRNFASRTRCLDTHSIDDGSNGPIIAKMKLHFSWSTEFLLKKAGNAFRVYVSNGSCPIKSPVCFYFAAQIAVENLRKGTSQYKSCQPVLRSRIMIHNDQTSRKIYSHIFMIATNNNGVWIG
jgi:hypothetical protein